MSGRASLTCTRLRLAGRAHDRRRAVLVNTQHKFRRFSVAVTVFEHFSPYFWLILARQMRRRIAAYLLGLGGWNHHPAKESTTLRTQEECLVDRKFYCISVASIHFTEISTTGMQQMVGVICPLLGMCYALFLSPASHIDPMLVT